MVSDKELLIQSLETYVTKTVNKLFGISSLPAQTLLKYGVRNLTDRYGFILDVFTTKEGRIKCTNASWQLLKVKLKNRGGFKIWNINSLKGFEQIFDIYCELQKNNV